MKRALTFLLIGLMILSITMLFPSSTYKQKVNHQNSTLNMALTGDLLFEQGLYDWSNQYDFKDYFDQVKPYLQSDLTIGNQEVPIGGQALGVSGVAYTFNAPEQVAPQLKKAGFDVLTLANNHTLDRGLEGISHTKAYLNQAGIQTTGAFTQSDEDHLLIIKRKGIKVGILAYTYGTNQSPVNEYSVPTFVDEQGQIKTAFLTKEIRQARKQVDVLLVAMHWGTEFTTELNQTQIQASQLLADLDVDVIIGNHPHTIQAKQVLKHGSHQTLCYYALGNFVSAAALVDRASPDFQNLYEIGAIARLKVSQHKGKIRVKEEEMVPIVNHFEDSYTHFKLIPLKDYTEKMAEKHMQHIFNEDFTLKWIQSKIKEIWKESKI